MLFKIDGGADAERVELRGGSFAGNATDKKFISKLKVSTGGSFSDGFAVAQIFSESVSRPIFRVEMIGSRNGLTNHL